MLEEAGFAVPPDPTVLDPVADELGVAATWTPRPGGRGFFKVTADAEAPDDPPETAPASDTVLSPHESNSPEADAGA